MKEEKISMRPYIHILYIIFLALLMASCNSAEKSLKKGDIAYNLGEYSDAAGHYKKAYSRYAPKEREQRG